MFQLTREEVESLRSQFAILKSGRGSHVKLLPYAFTEHGAIQAANSSNCAICWLPTRNWR
ncbi:ORF6N domain-containing protein [Steroidobacter cummioxidans]|uniref:ORF6N domain-containing protein n=1 Tax=Steroidobacter cummioxidans TaxID=1803913 RepID=UPI0023AEF89F|nr:ORF6N domain-containing protein [Steroidobacter cummioxidans]